MAIVSMVCGIVGIIGSLISGIRLMQLYELRNRVGVLFHWQIDNQIAIATIFLVISVILLILAIVFGIIEKKKGKTYKYYKMAMAGYILGLIGIILPIVLVVLTTTISVITFNVVNRDRAQTVIIDTDSPYVGRRPEYGYFEGIGTVNVRTRDNFTVTVDMIIGFDLDDQSASQELYNRILELRDFTQRYFSSKTVTELAPDREEALKREIRETLNTRFLDHRGVRLILFRRLDVMEIE